MVAWPPNDSEILFKNMGDDKYGARKGSNRPRENAILIRARWKSQSVRKICPDVSVYTQVYRLTRLAYLIFSAALNLTTNAAWTPINRGVARPDVRLHTRRI